MNFFIIHGVFANPDSNWFPWLKKELESKRYEVKIPKFPTPFDQSLESWLRTIAKYEHEINEQTILIGHSLGAVFILNYLGSRRKIVKAAILVAGYHQLLDNEFKELNKSFFQKEFDWNMIRNNCGKFFVVASDNDPYIPSNVNDELAKILHAKLSVIRNGGHLNKKGFEKFPELLELILNYAEA